MSNIHDGLRAIFIHNPKAAGTSIAVALGLDHCHDTQDAARERHGAEKWASYYKFAFARSPCERLISTYEFAQMPRSWYHDNVSPGEYGSHGDAHPDYEAVKGKSLDECLRMLLQDPASLKQPGWLPQSHFIADPDGLDFVGRYENLEADWGKVCGALGVDLALGRINPSAPARDRREYYTPFACEAAARLYRKDFVLFGYRLPLPYRPDPTREPMTVARAAHGVAGIVKAIAGTGGANEEMIQSRTEICSTCEHATVTLGVLNRCDLCGCATWGKVRNASERCPAGKWESVAPAA